MKSEKPLHLLPVLCSIDDNWQHGAAGGLRAKDRGQVGHGEQHGHAVQVVRVVDLLHHLQRTGQRRTDGWRARKTKWPCDHPLSARMVGVARPLLAMSTKSTVSAR